MVVPVSVQDLNAPTANEKRRTLVMPDLAKLLEGVHTLVILLKQTLLSRTSWRQGLHDAHRNSSLRRGHAQRAALE